MTPDLRQVRYFVAVAEDLNFTRAAERLHMAQPPLSAAIRGLEEQLGVELLERTTREVKLTTAGRLLLERGRELLAQADALFDAVRAVEKAPTGRISIGVAPTARFGLAPELFAVCAAQAPGVMLYPREDTTGALMRELRQGRLDVVIGFCAPPDDALERERLRDEPAVIHVADDHRLAGRDSVRLEDLADETFVVAGSPDSPGYTRIVVELCRAAGFEPATAQDPYPDLGLQAVREGIGIVLYVRTAFAPDMPGSVFIPVDTEVTFPFDLLWRRGGRSGALEATLDVARGLRDGIRAPEE
ncbi:MAG: LysR substrate-binding domain-containing protein [Mycobacteriales bacterium]